MILEERLTAFLNSLDTGNPAWLNELEKEARETNVPVIRTETQSLLRTLIAAKQPSEILEVGTAIGFSALCMSEYAPEGCHITTIEKYEKRIPVARENFRRFGKEKQITLLEGDAAQVLSCLEGPHGRPGTFDFIFMDAAKGQYPVLLPQVLRLLSDEQTMSLLNRTIHARMREYLYELKHHPALVTSILPVGDGVAVSVKREKE